ncbi:uncharacterized protein LOC122067300 [Macadamia integrifolia]|uniref:uncharacterized protein LOC122067300 n=1 Tax=Macadamia integrifolia TaxID=60698 RepID=UPI001C4FFBA0|nr:uncharacterized protein LOC122067300 [Macadamia integrifolia]
MAMSSLLSVSGFLSSPSRDVTQVTGWRSNLQKSFYGRFIDSKSFIRTEFSRSSRGCSVVASVLGRRVQKTESVIPDPDYRIPIVLLGLAGGLVYTDNLVAATPIGLLGLLLLFQTTRVRFVFDNEALEVKVGEQLVESGENVFVGGKNRWKFSSFVNWELWWPNFPILVYFKETQTKPEGQVHFFPVIFNGKQLYDVMVERAGPSKTSGPKQS